MFDRPQSGEVSLLVQVSIERKLGEADLDEFIELAKSAGATVVDSIHVVLRHITAKHLLGLGKVEEIAAFVVANNIELVVFNAALSPSQERNLERVFNCRVLDRTGLILDIFAQRARTHEGKLQVELAQLKHLSTRLVRGWTHLERQKGGIGLRGPGETQLETDRRLLAERIKYIERRLDKVISQRELVRKGRKRKGYPIVAVVGYTNAGKSTLFNKITGADVYAEDQLFATLDTTLRKLDHHGIGNSNNIILFTDTVGFVSDLPHELVAAFQSTLQETIEADLLLHVIDSADKEHLERERNVMEILANIGAADVPIIRVYNKIDLTNQNPQIIRQDGVIEAAFVSSVTQAGLVELTDCIVEYFFGVTKDITLIVSPSASKLRATLYDKNLVISEDYDQDANMIININVSSQTYMQLKTLFHDVWFEKKSI